MARIKTKDMSKLSIKLRHLKLAKAIVIEGKCYKDALLAAGYPLLTAQRDAYRIVRKAAPTIHEVMKKAGLTPEYLAAKMRELAEAKQYRPVTVKQPDGSFKVETWEAPDPRVQQQNVELVTEIEGMRRWGAPGSVGAANIVQLNVSFGGAGAAANASEKALPVQVTVVRPAQLGASRHEDEEPDAEDTLEPDPTGRAE